MWELDDSAVVAQDTQDCKTVQNCMIFIKLKYFGTTVILTFFPSTPSAPLVPAGPYKAIQIKNTINKKNKSVY